MKQHNPPGPPMTLNDSCRQQALIEVSSYPADTPVPRFRSKVKCANCGARGNRIDVRPNWKERTSKTHVVRMMQ